MRYRLLLILFSLLFSASAPAQTLLGIWRGYFYQGYGYYRQKYKYEVQLNELPNKASQKALQGVTYSYRTTVFYGKATLQGIYDAKEKSITLTETKLVELKIADKSDPCLMTCYLDYRKDGKVEILEGTFTSINTKTNGDCGSGYVYLERVTESDFKKEDFLLKKQQPKTQPLAKKPADTSKKITVKPPPVQNNSTAKTQQPSAQKKIATQPSAANKKSTAKVPPPANKNSNAQKNSQEKKIIIPPGSDTVAKINTTPLQTEKPAEKELAKKEIPVPDLIRKRENPLVKIITTNSPDILIQLYDNGEIDGDTITVYDNNEVLANRKGLTGKPITISVKADVNNSHHEFVMVANNLGAIPPNTALMIVTTGGKRYELFISSDEKKNAKVVIDFVVPSEKS